jgi:O-antigen/teichoic acid export membrane protein
MASLKEKTVEGLFWGALGNGGLQVLNLVFGIFLGRLLTPDDYGMIGMLTIFSLLATNLAESGFINALARKKEATHRDYNAVFWFSSLMSVAIYAILFLCAPLIARFFHQPALIPLSRFVFIGFVISGTAVVPSAIFYRNLKVKVRMASQLTALLTSGITGVTLAWIGMAYWGIAIQGVVYVSVYTFLMWYNAHWRPSWHIDFGPGREMFGYSSKLLVTSLFYHINNNVLSVLLGRWFLRSDVGHYTQASKWNTMGQSLISNMIGGVAMPVLASVEGERRLHIFRKMLRFVSFVAFPLMLGLGLVAEELIVITVTEKWLPAAALLQMLCVMGAFTPIISLYTNLIISDGHSDTYMYGTIILGALQIALLSITRHYGITVMVAVYTATAVAWLLYWHNRAWRIVGITLLAALKDMAPFLLTAVAALTAAYFATLPLDNVYLRMAGKMACAAVCYLGILRMAHAKILKESIDFLKGMRG